MTIRRDVDEVFDGNGNVISSVVVDRDITIETNEANVMERARSALATNATYLSQPPIPASPTLAQLTAATRIIRQQVDALTRQANGLIRLEISDLQDVGDT